MNVSVMQENLARGLGIVGRAVSSRATLPVLANVLLKTENAGLKLTATNLEIGINCWVPGKVVDEGEITVPAKLLADLVSSLPNQRIDLQFSAKDRTLKVTSGGSRSSIKGIEADEFPVVAAIGDTPATSADSRALRDALAEVVFAAASDESRPILTGVLTRLAGETMTLAAADNYRIAVRTLALAKAVTPEMTIVVPARSYAELMRILPDAEESIEITVTPNKSQVLFHVAGIDLVSRLIEGQFPNYEPVIPTAHTSRAVLDRFGYGYGHTTILERPRWVYSFVLNENFTAATNPFAQLRTINQRRIPLAQGNDRCRFGNGKIFAVMLDYPRAPRQF